MTTLIEKTDAFATQYEMISSQAAPEWLAARRAAAWTTFEENGFPTPKTEGWQFTDLRPITQGQFSLPSPEAGEAIDADMVARFAIPDLDAHQLVFVDGIFIPALSTIGDLPTGVVICSLGEAITSHADLVEPHLDHYAEAEWDAFTALNTAMMSDGAFVHVADDAKADKPILLTFISTGGEPIISHPRVLIVIADRARAEVIENHITLADGAYFTNAVTEIAVGEEAEAHHYFIEDDSEQAYNVSTLAIYQQARSDFRSHTILLGGKLVRNNCHPILDGEKIHSMLNGLYLPDGSRHMDNAMYVHHKKPGCDSRQYYTGIMRDKASAVFSGRIKVERPAQQTDAVQESRNLLLSDDASIHSQPQLEIFADDVKCTHGATIGQLDDDQLFYLESRGIPRETAQSILVYAFAAESIDRMDQPEVADYLGQKMIEHLRLGAAESIVA